MGFDAAALAECARKIVPLTRELAGLGFTPATSGNFSMRLDPHLVAITVSGRDKSRLTEADVIAVNLTGRPVATTHRPSSETPLHLQLYRHDPQIGCVLHTHSRNQTVSSRIFAMEGRVRLTGYELLKAFRRIDSHEEVLDVPVLANRQDMGALAVEIEPWLDRRPLWGYLIAGHGMYAWGADLEEARRHLEAFDFLLACELDLRRPR